MKLFYTKTLFLLALCFSSLFAMAHGNDNISVFRDTGVRIDAPEQQLNLRFNAEWEAFTERNGHWFVNFDVLTKTPIRAAGKPITVPNQGSLVANALYFIDKELAAYNFPTNNLIHFHTLEGDVLTNVRFVQTYNGLEILGSRVDIRFNQAGQIAAFTASVHPTLSVEVTPTLSNSDIIAYGTNDIAGNFNATESPVLKIMAAPTTKGYEYKLVYEYNVEGTKVDGHLAKFYIVADANTGEVYYRYNKVHNCAPDESGIAMNGEMQDNPGDPIVSRALPNMRVRIGSTDYFTDADGNLDYSFPPGFPVAVDATAYLEGPYCRVHDGITSTAVPSYDVTINPGDSQVNLDIPSDEIPEVSAFYHVNEVHRFMKSWVPEFTFMDNPMVTRVNRDDGSCNAFYDGNVNFYSQGGGCWNTALFRDIVYHEYGHGINYDYYAFLGGGFNNGALGEGYADVWGLGITEYPILAQGFNIGSGNSFIRRYDINPKVYPEDLVGQVHADGEIICGAWWDLGVEIGVQEMFGIFIGSHQGVPMRPDGQEGALYSDILFEALLADDTNGDLSDGTPNSEAIIENFALHGILLQIAADIGHEEYPTLPAADLTQIDFTLQIDFNYQPFVEMVNVHFRTDRSVPYTFTSGVNLGVSAIDYTAFIPGLEAGTLVDYYFEVTDNFGGNPVAIPFLANREENPNIPYQLLINYDLAMEDNLYSTTGWTTGVAGDDASTGEWVISSPNESQVDNGATVQTGSDNTPSADNYCAFTGNAPSGDGAGANDVDDGVTTLLSPVMDMRDYEQPVIAYHRYYSNDKGANPGNDFWEVYISNDEGATWVEVENTNVADDSWRLHALKVSDYVVPTSLVQMRFVASDPLIGGLEFDGGSLVEAALDDLTIYELGAVGGSVGISDVTKANLAIYPNPAQDVITISPVDGVATQNTVTIELVNATGQLVRQFNDVNLQNRFQINMGEMANGVYMVKAYNNQISMQSKVVVAK